MRFGVIYRVKADGLTYLETAALRDLAREVRAIERNRREGCIVEAGCALGGSALVLTAAKSPDRPLLVYDVFGMIPPPTDADGTDVQERYAVIASGRSSGLKGEPYYGYEPDLRAKVADTFRHYGFPPERHHVELVKGLYEDTLRPSGPVALAHIDCDWYESVRTCLERISPHMVPGGRFVIDDYDAWSGCRKAVDEFLSRDETFTPVRRHRLHLVKSRDIALKREPPRPP